MNGTFAASQPGNEESIVAIVESQLRVSCSKSSFSRSFDIVESPFQLSSAPAEQSSLLSDEPSDEAVLQVENKAFLMPPISASPSSSSSERTASKSSKSGTNQN